MLALVRERSAIRAMRIPRSYRVIHDERAEAALNCQRAVARICLYRESFAMLVERAAAIRSYIAVTSTSSIGNELLV